MGHKMMTDDPKSIVAIGYDLIEEGYLERYGRSPLALTRFDPLVLTGFDPPL
jgi:hypothetical protein